MSDSFTKKLQNWVCLYGFFYTDLSVLQLSEYLSLNPFDNMSPEFEQEKCPLDPEVWLLPINFSSVAGFEIDNWSLHQERTVEEINWFQ